MEVKLKQLTDSVGKKTGITWGVPWEQGVLQKEEDVSLFDASGKALPLQTWTTAFWPDGSVKWTAHATSLLDNKDTPYTIKKTKYTVKNPTLKVRQGKGNIEVNTGKVSYIIGTEGAEIIQKIFIGQKLICSGSRLICVREERNCTFGQRTYKEEDFYSIIHHVKVEQNGPIRCVIRIEGKHQLLNETNQWLPFTIRLYFYAGQDSMKMVYTFFYDGNPHMDFIKGLGIQFQVPLQGELYNRHIRLGGDTGFFCDSPKNLDTWRTRGKYVDFFKAQIEGEILTFDKKEDEHFLSLLDESAVWNDFKIIQDSSDHFILLKRTKEGCSWLKADEGNRAMGLAYLGSKEGGIAIGKKDFWEKYPSSFEISNMTTNQGKITLWLWSPDSKAMDLRHYDTETHVLSGYEGFREMRSTPYGIANTNEIFLQCFETTPKHEILMEMRKQVQHPPLLVCKPEYYHQTKVFGVWSLIDKSSDIKKQLEKELKDGYEFFINQQAQWKWYGFWDYGDIMRAYDPVRHTWRYDVGGFAWNNNEFNPNIWLWYMFLRSGQEEIFRTAEAFTRHASEVDQYHFGQYKGFGSRHNVMHWGCGCKEVRMSMAAIHKFYYFLTGDERVGEILDEVKDVDYNVVNLDPMRAYFSKGDVPTHVRVSPDWAAFTSNWMTQWERYEDKTYKQKIVKGIEDISNMPYQLCSGPVYGYDPKTNELMYMGDDLTSFHMMNCFGAPGVWMELSNLLKNPKWDQMLADYGEFYLLDDEEKLKRRPDMMSCKNWGSKDTALSLAAFSAVVNKNKKLAEKVWNHLLYEGENNGVLHSKDASKNKQKVKSLACPRIIKEIPWANSGMTLRYLFIIQCLELIGDWIPEERRN